MPDHTKDTLDRAMGALVGGALGDALGMPTQLLSPARIAELYGHVEGFIAPFADHPVSKGLPAGAITDDTEQALLLGRILVESGNRFDHTRWVNALLDWEREVKARGSYDLLGPSTKRAIDAINNGVPAEEAGRNGDTNGAAMRIAPVGIMMPLEPLDALVAKVAETCRATHNTSIAIASAAAVAAAVSCGVTGGDWRTASDSAIAAAKRGATLGHWVTGGDIAARIAWAQDIVRGKATKEAIGLITDLVGTGVASQESVPAAFAVLEVAGGDPWQAAVISANLGGDTDTIGAIAAGMAGACTGFLRLPQDRIADLKGIHIAEVRALAADLVAARMSKGCADKTSTGKDAAACGRLVHVGSAVVDYVYRIDALPAPGTEKTASSYAHFAGGGFNMMVAATRTGMTVVFGGQLGSGPNGDFLRAAFATEGIETLTPPSPVMDSGNCVAMISSNAERTFVSWPGAESLLSLDMMAPVVVAPGDWVFASGYTLSYPKSRDALTDWIKALPAETPLVFDPTPVIIDIPRPVLSRVLARTTWLSCNTAEAAEIAGPGEVAAVAALLLEAHCPKADGVVIRAGAIGCHVRLADGTAQTIAGFKVEAIDTNGAGDTHIGAFVSALARGVQPFEAARYANAAAALSVTRHGGSSAPTDQEIQIFLNHDAAAHGGTRRLMPTSLKV